MLNLIKHTIGTNGPLLVEHNGRVLSETCMIITEKHTNNMIKRLESLKINHIEQTSDRSFSVSFK